ncbi:hypothetical protein [Kribbella deserti]|uniref:Uncharacterized protein n=1 Tax=Kribbella deserti TaxID=1926257 RepID=A0ABV6QM03_9ACTN
MAKSRGGDKRRTHLRLVGSSDGPAPSRPSDGPDPEPRDAVLDTLQETLTLDLAAAPAELLPVIAEASVARLSTMVADKLWPEDAPEEIGEVERLFWMDVARVLADRRDAESFVLLTGLARTVGQAGRLPLQRALMTRSRVTADVPAWVERIATFRLTSTVLSEDISGDGLSVVLDYDDEYHPHTVIVFVDNNLGALVKDVFVGPPLQQVVEAYQRGGRVKVRTVRPAVAAGIILQALGETNEYDDPPVTDDFEFFSGLLVNRLTQLPERPIRPPVQARWSGRQRDRLVSDFLAWAGADELPDDAAGIARLWLDHALDYTAGGPLRVSAVLVELFITQWIPNKVIADSNYSRAVPPVLKAWLRFAAERSEVDQETLAEALDAVDTWSPALWFRPPGEPVEIPTPSVEDLEAMTLILPGAGSPPDPDLDGLGQADAATLVLLAPHAWTLAGETLGPAYALEAFTLAERLVREAPQLLTKARLSTWPRAIVWSVATRHGLLSSGSCLTPVGLAGDLNSSPPTLRKTAKLLQETLDPGT